MNNGTVEFVDFEGGEALVIPSGEGGGPRSFKEPSVATVTLQHEDSMYSIQSYLISFTMYRMCELSSKMGNV